jgi:hypothetical protein
MERQGGFMSDGLSDLVMGSQQRVKELRKSGDLAALLAAAEAGADAIERRAGEGASDLDREALIAVKRFTYNAAADCWPGWSVPTAAPDPRILAAGSNMARRSHGLVVKLGLGPIQEATGTWLVGAFELALGRYAEAREAFARARESYIAAQAPGLALLTEGYLAIVHGDVEAVCARIAAGGFEDGPEWIEQLRTAAKVFGRQGSGLGIPVRGP